MARAIRLSNSSRGRDEVRDASGTAADEQPRAHPLGPLVNTLDHNDGHAGEDRRARDGVHVLLLRRDSATRPGSFSRLQLDRLCDAHRGVSRFRLRRLDEQSALKQSIRWEAASDMVARALHPYCARRGRDCMGTCHRNARFGGWLDDGRQIFVKNSSLRRKSCAGYGECSRTDAFRILAVCGFWGRRLQRRGSGWWPILWHLQQVHPDRPSGAGPRLELGGRYRSAARCPQARVVGSVLLLLSHLDLLKLVITPIIPGDFAGENGPVRRGRRT